MLNVLMLENDADDRYITQSEISELGIPVRLSFDIYSNDLLKKPDGFDLDRTEPAFAPHVGF